MTKFEILTLVISGIALLISLITYYENRKRIEVTFPDNLEILLYDKISIGNQNNLSDKVECYFYLPLEIVNDSPHDIGFFDLRAFNPKTNINYRILTWKTIPPALQGHPIYDFSDPLFIRTMEIPEKNHGLFTANSFKRLDLLIYTTSELPLDQAITVVFKIARPRRFWEFKDPFAVTNRKKFKFFGKNFIITGYQEVLKPKQSTKEEKKQE